MADSGMLSLEEARDALAHGTGTGVKIAVIDSGIEVAHPDLSGLSLADDVAFERDELQLRMVPGDGRDVFGHGTAIASILRTVAPDVTIGSFRVLDGQLASRTAVIQEGVRQAIDRGYHILNCSFGCRGEAQYLMPYKEWVDEAYLKGIHTVAACNNFDFSVREWPGHFPTVITVNMARTTGLTFYYARGNLVEFAAAGESVEVAWMDAARKNVTGSSYAAPVVAGLLARLLSCHPALPPLEAKALMHRIAESFHKDVAASNVCDEQLAPLVTRAQ
jgi:subtilisin family serine protease